LQVEVIEDIDVADAKSPNKVSQALSGRSIDCLINNAGILRNETLGSLDFDSIDAQWQVNALGPLRLTEALLPQMTRPSKIAFITSRMGSMRDNASGGYYGYRMSKAALNAAAVSLARDLQPRDVYVAILHPGLVGTEMIGGHGDITPEIAAERLMQRIDNLTAETSGTFLHSNGETLPW
jgi:NAD(P)-dependent dehydrogenase (short-subunit alcohol dehydrogenase family)